MIRNHKQAGFTLIELMLAMGGIAFLLLFVVFAIMHVTNLYGKGVAIRQINQIGRQISDEISREVRFGENPKMGVKNRFCVNDKSYIWNPTGSTDNKFNSGATVGFVKVDGINYCNDPAPLIPNDAKELLGNVATILDMTIVEDPVSSGLFELTLVLGTKNDPPTWQSVSGQFECSSIGGQFCAVGEFKTIIYARKR